MIVSQAFPISPRPSLSKSILTPELAVVYTSFFFLWDLHNIRACYVYTLAIRVEITRVKKPFYLSMLSDRTRGSCWVYISELQSRSLKEISEDTKVKISPLHRLDKAAPCKIKAPTFSKPGPFVLQWQNFHVLQTRLGKPSAADQHWES